MIGSFLFQATALGFGLAQCRAAAHGPPSSSSLSSSLRVWFGSPLGWREAIATVLTVAGTGWLPGD